MNSRNSVFCLSCMFAHCNKFLHICSKIYRNEGQLKTIAQHCIWIWLMTLLIKIKTKRMCFIFLIHQYIYFTVKVHKIVSNFKLSFSQSGLWPSSVSADEMQVMLHSTVSKRHFNYPHAAADMVQGTKQNAKIIKHPLPLTLISMTFCTMADKVH